MTSLQPTQAQGLGCTRGMQQGCYTVNTDLYSVVKIHGMIQEYITERVCNSHMVSVPAIWIG